MIRHIRLKNFKAFEQLDIELFPITVVLGPNNSGKSSILAPIRLLVQTLESHDLEVPLLLSGMFGDFGTYKDLVYGNHRGRPLEIHLSLVPSPRSYYLRDAASVSLELAFKHRTQRRETILRTAVFYVDEDPVIRLGYSLKSERHLIDTLAGTAVPSALKAPLAEHLSVSHFLPYVYLSPRRDKGEGKLEEFLGEFPREVIRRPHWVSQSIQSTLAATDYIGAMRSPPHRTYLFTGEKRRRIGASGEHAASLFMLDEMRRGEREGDFSAKTSEWLRKARIADDVQVAMLSDRHYELRIKHPVTGESQNIADVGYGNSQVFPVIIGGYRLAEGSLYLVEEPEIHLHPRAEAELGDFFFDLYDQGVQSVVETHGEHLVLRLQQHVAAGHLNPDHVGVYYVYPHEDGNKEVTRLRLDEDGRFIDEWPEGFFPERLSEAKRLSQIRHLEAV